jgi:hypothetical protein
MFSSDLEDSDHFEALNYLKQPLFYYLVFKLACLSLLINFHPSLIFKMEIELTVSLRFCQYGTLSP